MKQPELDGAQGADERRELGRSIRALRRARGLRLADVSRSAGVSVSLLSQVERGLLDPSLESLRKVASALGTTPFRLFQPTSARSGLVRARERRRLPAAPNSGLIVELLSPHRDGSFEVSCWTLLPGAASSADPVVHA